MMKWKALLPVFSLGLISLAHANRATAQGKDADENYFLRNNGLNLGWNMFQPSWASMDGLVNHFNEETGFAHTPMNAPSSGDGFVMGFTLFPSRHWHTDAEYRSQRVTTNEVYLQKTPSDAAKMYQLRMFLHSFHYSLSYGVVAGRYGTTGLYVGAGLYAGTWDIKYRSATQDKWARQTSDDFHGFNMGISPQIIFRTYLLEVKAYYDVPFWTNNFGPAYDEIFKDYSTHASGDLRLKKRNTSLGVAATLCIPVFRSEAQRREDAARRAAQATDGSKPNRFQQRQEQDKNAREQKEKIDQMREQQQREEQKSNERKHERERRGY